MLDRVEKRLAKQFEAQALQIKARQTAQLEHIAEEAMEGWERSKEDAETERVVTKALGTKPGEKVPVPEPAGGAEVPGMYLDAQTGEEVDRETAAQRVADAAVQRARGEVGNLTVVEQTTTSERKGQAGDPRMLAEARGALADIRNIWGLDAPKKGELSGPNGAPIPVSVEDAINRVYGQPEDTSGPAQ